LNFLCQEYPCQLRHRLSIPPAARQYSLFSAQLGPAGGASPDREG
jgi:hypothetical protein